MFPRFVPWFSHFSVDFSHDFPIFQLIFPMIFPFFSWFSHDSHGGCCRARPEACGSTWCTTPRWWRAHGLGRCGGCRICRRRLERRWGPAPCDAASVLGSWNGWCFGRCLMCPFYRCNMSNYYWLVSWKMFDDFDVSRNIGNFVIWTDGLIFFRGAWPWLIIKNALQIITRIMHRASSSILPQFFVGKIGMVNHG